MKNQLEHHNKQFADYLSFIVLEKYHGLDEGFVKLNCQKRGCIPSSFGDPIFEHKCHYRFWDDDKYSLLKEGKWIVEKGNENDSNDSDFRIIHSEPGRPEGIVQYSERKYKSFDEIKNEFQDITIDCWNHFSSQRYYFKNGIRIEITKFDNDDPYVLYSLKRTVNNEEEKEGQLSDLIKEFRLLEKTGFGIARSSQTELLFRKGKTDLLDILAQKKLFPKSLIDKAGCDSHFGPESFEHNGQTYRFNSEERVYIPISTKQTLTKLTKEEEEWAKGNSDKQLHEIINDLNGPKNSTNNCQ